MESVPIRGQSSKARSANPFLSPPVLTTSTRLPYHVANNLTRLVASGLFPFEQVNETWLAVTTIPVIHHALQTGEERVVTAALSLHRQSAYDVACVALAQELAAELWSLHGPLARNASEVGVPVHLIEQEDRRKACARYAGNARSCGAL